MPKDIQRTMGYALWVAQIGKMADYARPMRGSLRDVVEIRDDDGSGTYRVMYTTTVGEYVYALDAFKKKSKKGIETPKTDLNRIEKRLKIAREKHEEEHRSRR